MELVCVPGSWEDYLYWQNTDKEMLVRINDLIKDVLRSPFKGIGKPEPLKGNFSLPSKRLLRIIAAPRSKWDLCEAFSAVFWFVSSRR